MTKINDLPSLSANNFDPTQDLIIIQKPNGATYKMLAATALSSIAQGEFQTETKTTTTSFNNPGSITFSYANLTSQNSSIVLRLTSGLVSGTFTLTKTAGIQNFNNYGVPSTTNDVILLGDSSRRLVATIKIYQDSVEISNIKPQRYKSGKGFRGWGGDYGSYSVSATIQANIKL
jgi:2',3'-cyclic-nucleotide 2'-phosphodiesterase (5'-nucleotidase family)